MSGIRDYSFLTVYVLENQPNGLEKCGLTRIGAEVKADFSSVHALSATSVHLNFCGFFNRFEMCAAKFSMNLLYHPSHTQESLNILKRARNGIIDY